MTSSATARRLHPSTELVLLLCGLLLVYGVPSPLVPAVVLLSAAVGAAVTRHLRLKSWALTLLVLAGPMLVMVTIIQGLFYPGEAVHILWSAGPAAITAEGLAVALQLWLRVAAMIGLCALFAFGADAARVFDAMIGLRLPLNVAYVCAAAMNLLPLLRERTARTMAARAARGWDTTSLRVRLRLLPGILSGLLTALLVQLDQRHDALNQRGFGAVPRPAPARSYPSGTGQQVLRWSAALGSSALVVLALLDLLPLPTASDVLEVLYG